MPKNDPVAFELTVTVTWREVVATVKLAAVMIAVGVAGVVIGRRVDSPVVDYSCGVVMGSAVTWYWVVLTD